MHDRIETDVLPEGRGYNVSRQTGEWLRPLFGFERMTYSSPLTAALAADARANLFNQLVEAIAAQRLQDQRLGFLPAFVPRISLEGLIHAYAHVPQRLRLHTGGPIR